MGPKGTYKQLDPLEEPRPEPPKRPPLGAFLVPPLLLLLLLVLVVTFGLSRPPKDPPGDPPGDPKPCEDPCRIVLVESTPQGMPPGPNPSTFSAWSSLLAGAARTLEVASFYWTLTNEDTATHEPSAAPGEQILSELLELPRRGVSVRVAVNAPSKSTPMGDLQALERSGASVRAVDLENLTGGVLHTKLWVVDRRHLYLGSANMDWRALTQVKELGVVIYNCSCLAQDVAKIFEAYWALGVPGATIPSPWPESFSTSFNRETPLALTLNGSDASVYFSSSPPPLCAEGRTPDLEALLAVIDGAGRFVDVSVMSYVAGTEFSRPRRFWPAVDERLRRAAVERGVAVRLLAGCWAHSSPLMFPFLRSLAALGGERFHVQVRLFVVPQDPPQSRIPFARVNHNKFMVTDRAAYVGTSNWSGDYFERSGGSALVLSQPGGGPGTFRERLRELFQRDWGSPHSVDIGDPQGWAGRCGPP